MDIDSHLTKIMGLFLIRHIHIERVVMTAIVGLVVSAYQRNETHIRCVGTIGLIVLQAVQKRGDRRARTGGITRSCKR